MKLTVSAPGKLMLLGEHAVVYGHPCIVTAISERLYVSASEKNDMPGDTRFVDAAVNAWGNGASFAFSTKSIFSGRYGLGSSSAVTVATLKAIRSNATNEELFDAAYKIVLDIQGKASGFDIAAAIWGGTLYYEKTKPTIEAMNTTPIPIIVGYTGVKADTTAMIEDVAKKREKEPQKVERIFDAIGKIVLDTKEKMIEGDWERVGKLMDFNQEYLRDLGVSSEKLEALIKAAVDAGAWGAKLSGAGGGDCMIALSSHEKSAAVEQAIEQAGGQVIHIMAGAEGVRVES